ncbi:MAG TPA: type 1 glutamine amidotransferase domain-containing protein [Acetomicrobium flavidum]|uniref:type 1 glutamine amidotransferase domain-containing protein n=1 Tax=Acetomicrobium flavidum TaxID=49896 RepID=UPI001B5FB57D|nr:type 1 glutamine amidotransferase [Acetomicrobium sp.]HOJ82533.1 type 1 glutamine amidotransferase domain-containing protein [Acetomicrobium flavidum]HOM31598.1 type 1 glutamine amidotransferase domain-containing protein [Acetomicrobium flavidum]HOP88130.1 type 1 glutamine amidotransferase domain-containing protein [Acetomicrobium flavidum]HPP14772.1 type 1 glutamine amidotransferase domain-containing protein [Acetomicrobium flavidum]
MSKLNGKRFILFVEDEYEDLELWYPKIRLIEEGAETVVAGPEKGKLYRGKHGYPCKSDVSFDEVNPDSFDGIVIPGGYAPDKIRRHKKALDIVKKLNDSNKIVAFICHAGWVPISAGILKGRKATSVGAIKDDMVNAGVNWIDEAVVVDGNLISSRTPDDLPQFCKAIIEKASSSCHSCC